MKQQKLHECTRNKKMAWAITINPCILSIHRNSLAHWLLIISLAEYQSLIELFSEN
jgi:hypothetical protein